MLEKNLETKSAGFYAYAAARDARMKSYAASTFYSEKEKIAAERVRLALELVYKSSEVFVTYRKKFVSIKLNKPFVRNRTDLVSLEQEFEKRGYIKATTEQGITYRIPKI
jgi:hypothetical protein